MIHRRFVLIVSVLGPTKQKIDQVYVENPVQGRKQCQIIRMP